MSAEASPEERREALTHWRKRSRMVRVFRWVLPLAMVILVLALAGQIALRSLQRTQAPSKDTQAPIRLVNPRFFGRDSEGRAFTITAQAAERDEKNYQSVKLKTPQLVLQDGGSGASQLTAVSGVYDEAAKVLQLKGQVRIKGRGSEIVTESSTFNTATGEIVGQGPIKATGELGEITAKSYGVYDKGGRMVFKGGVRGRINAKQQQQQ